MPTIIIPPPEMPQPMPRRQRSPLTRVIVGVTALLVSAVSIGGSVALSGMRESAVRAQKHAQERACFASQRILESVVEIERAESHAAPADMAALQAAAIRMSGEIPECEFGGKLEYDPQTGSVSCTKHGAASSEEQPGALSRHSSR